MVQNLFLAPAQSPAQQLLPLLRPTLALHTPKELLASLWQRDVGRALTDDQSHLIGACTSSLDARKLYLAFGAAPLVECTWCRADDFAGRGDFVAFVMTSVVGTYLAVTALGAGLLSGERVRWRGWYVVLVVVAFLGEVWWRLNWAGPGNSAVLLVSSSPIKSSASLSS